MSNKDQYDVGPPPADGDKNYGGILIGVNWAVFMPATIFVALRVFTRARISHNLGWDDAMMVFAAATNSVGMGFVMLECHYGLGRHRYFLNPNHYEGFLKYNYLDWNQVFITLCACKLAICMFLLRLSKFAKWRNFLYGVMAFLVLSLLPLELLFLLQCIPLNKNWDMDVSGTCFSKPTVEKIIIVQGVFSILTDLVLALFPTLLLSTLRLPRRQKIQLSLLLGLGIITAFACIARTAFSYEIKQSDVTWQGVPNALCRMLEINLGIIAACMPMMRTLFIHCKKRYIHTRDTQSLSSTRTPASQLQWYAPPTRTPWYLRVKRSLRHAPPAMHMSQQPSSGASDSERSLPKTDSRIEHLSRPPLPNRKSKSSAFLRPPLPLRKSTPRITIPLPRAQLKEDSNPIPKRSHWPHDHRVKPENATWAKDESLRGSFDLPIQGPRREGWQEQTGGDGNGNTVSEKNGEVEAGFRPSTYHRTWV